MYLFYSFFCCIRKDLGGTHKVSCSCWAFYTVYYHLYLSPAWSGGVQSSITKSNERREGEADRGCVHKLIDTIGESKEGVATSPQWTAIAWVHTGAGSHTLASDSQSLRSACMRTRVRECGLDCVPPIPHLLWHQRGVSHRALTSPDCINEHQVTGYVARYGKTPNWRGRAYCQPVNLSLTA